MILSSLALNRLRVMKSGHAVYDQFFHLGVNIIRGENGSGKSTIADFIFYVLGGEFDEWKETASLCDEVQAEISTLNGIITIKREVDKKQTPLNIFYGSMLDAEKSALDNWNRFPIRRNENQESSSQILFRAIGIPEAQSQGSSNITMHQILRLLYADQRTPAPRLFRFESFDTRDIRSTVGDLMCGINGYEHYDIQLNLKQLNKRFEEKQREYSLLLAALPIEEALITFDALSNNITNLQSEKSAVLKEIENVDEYIDKKEIHSFLEQRKISLKELDKKKNIYRKNEKKYEELRLELSDLIEYTNYLGNLYQKIPLVERSSELIGNIDFTHCPACLEKLKPRSDSDQCFVCHERINPEKDRSKYLQIKMDIDIQLREAKQLEDEKNHAINNLVNENRKIKREYEALLSNFTVNYDISISPRESFLAQKNNRLGQIEREIEYLSRLFLTVERLQAASKEKSEIQEEINILKDRQTALAYKEIKRRSIALTKLSSITSGLLHEDLNRQIEFVNANTVNFDFGDDAIFVDGKLNFAESSNVILKNSAILSLLIAATSDSNFYHPRFLLLDNVEDKGMEQVRSQHFQKLIIEHSKKAKFPHQIIFTTSMINPEFDLPEFVIGPAYTSDNRTLNIKSNA